MIRFYLDGLGGLPVASAELGEPLKALLTGAMEGDAGDAELYRALSSLDERLLSRALLALGRWSRVRGVHAQLVSLDDLRARAEAVGQAEGEEARLDGEALTALVMALGGEG